jgi:hypothetical protein
LRQRRLPSFLPSFLPWTEVVWTESTLRKTCGCRLFKRREDDGIGDGDDDDDDDEVVKKRRWPDVQRVEAQI